MQDDDGRDGGEVMTDGRNVVLFPVNARPLAGAGETGDGPAAVIELYGRREDPEPEHSRTLTGDEVAALARRMIDLTPRREVRGGPPEPRPIDRICSALAQAGWSHQADGHADAPPTPDEAVTIVGGLVAGRFRTVWSGGAKAQLWDAVNRYAECCGGDTSAGVGGIPRERAVVDVEEAVGAALLEAIEARIDSPDLAAFGVEVTVDGQRVDPARVRFRRRRVSGVGTDHLAVDELDAPAVPLEQALRWAADRLERVLRPDEAHIGVVDNAREDAMMRFAVALLRSCAGVAAKPWPLIAAVDQAREEGRVFRPEWLTAAQLAERVRGPSGGERMAHLLYPQEFRPEAFGVPADLLGQPGSESQAAADLAAAHHAARMEAKREARHTVPHGTPDERTLQVLEGGRRPHGFTERLLEDDPPPSLLGGCRTCLHRDPDHDGRVFCGNPDVSDGTWVADNVPGGLAPDAADPKGCPGYARGPRTVLDFEGMPSEIDNGPDSPPDAWPDLSRPLQVSTCRKCDECDGYHHWLPTTDEAGNPVEECKHCEAVRPWVDEDDGPDVPICDGCYGELDPDGFCPTTGCEGEPVAPELDDAGGLPYGTEVFQIASDMLLEFGTALRDGDLDPAGRYIAADVLEMADVLATPPPPALLDTAPIGLAALVGDTVRALQGWTLVRLVVPAGGPEVEVHSEVDRAERVLRVSITDYRRPEARRPEEVLLGLYAAAAEFDGGEE